MYRDWGAERKYEHVLKGYNYRMEGIQGAILRVKLRHLESWTACRQAHAREYTRLLEGSGVKTPAVMSWGTHGFDVYAIFSPRRDDLQRELQENGIQTGIHYPFPIHLLEAWRDLGYPKGSFPVSEQVAAEELSLPIYPELTSEQIETVTSTVGGHLVAR